MRSCAAVVGAGRRNAPARAARIAALPEADAYRDVRPLRREPK